MDIVSLQKIYGQYYPFWNHLSEQEKNIFCSCSLQKTFNKGEIINRSEQCSGFILILSGQMRIYILSEEGRDVTLFRLSTGNICVFTARCVLDSISYDVLIEAEDTLEVLILPPKKFYEISAENIYVKCFGYQLAAQRFSEAMWTLQQVLFMRADRRLARLLYGEMEKLQTDEIKLTHEQIAKYMGSAREVVSRLLKYFVDDNIVELARGTVKIVDKEKLILMTK